MCCRVESYFRFLTIHLLGALACALPFVCPQPFKGIILTLLLITFALAWWYRRQSDLLRDGITATVCGPIAVLVAFYLCMHSPRATEQEVPGLFIGLFVAFAIRSLVSVNMATKGQYLLLITLAPIALFSICWEDVYRW